jgi:hypothetical protein
MAMSAVEWRGMMTVVGKHTSVLEIRSELVAHAQTL